MKSRSMLPITSTKWWVLQFPEKMTSEACLENRILRAHLFQKQRHDHATATATIPGQGLNHWCIHPSLLFSSKIKTLAQFRLHIVTYNLKCSPVQIVFKLTQITLDGENKALYDIKRRMTRHVVQWPNGPRERNSSYADSKDLTSSGSLVIILAVQNIRKEWGYYSKICTMVTLALADLASVER
jgi:hypothetical protein